ncbi:MAG TPA: Xaa-Pro peptidase family protein [Gammaproteobacteria bacterium]|nr:Xaa-Pro peptidase family protein [Gammaproteobacteria bacterium]
MARSAKVDPADDISEALVSGVRRGRLARIRAQMVARDIGALVLVDPVNVRYATDTRNMQIFTARNPARYAFIAAEGPVVLFEFAGCAHLAAGNELVDEVRIATTASYVAAGGRLENATRRWAAEIADLARTYGGGNRRLGVERFNAAAAYALDSEGFEVVDAQEAVERARCIKVSGEIALMQSSMAAVEEGVARLKAALRPGLSEQALWSKLWAHVIETGGDYVETRLLNSGARSNPWFRECSQKIIEQGELVLLDTDVVGRYGYYADFSRTFLCGQVQPRPEQKRCYRLAYEQIHHNLELMRPGMSFAEVSEKGWRIPDRYHAHRYYLLAHGIGMTGEYPYILYKDDFDTGGYDGVIEPGMVLCVESFIGAEDGGEGVKLEQQVQITDSGYELMSNFPFEAELLGREI